MKRLLTVLAVLLLVLATGISSVNARRNPIAIPYPRPSGEDHPWGGEQNYLPDSHVAQPGTSSGPAPGVIGIETSLLWKLVMPLWLEKFYGGTVVTVLQPNTNPDIITGEDNSTTTTTNNRPGN